MAEIAYRLRERRKAGTRPAPTEAAVDDDLEGRAGPLAALGYIRTLNWLAWCQGGVAGGLPPHKGGPERPDRPTAVIRDS
ncbi:MAG: hypothetical protein OXF86_11040 [Caldilineaceae bacterium]|nr:hypothetical protein [Caldilineaceae bacterium]